MLRGLGEAVGRAAAAAARSQAAARVAARASARPRAVLETARAAGAELLGLLRTEAALARLEMAEQMPGVLRGGLLAGIGLALLGLVPVLLASAFVLWLGPRVGYAEAALLAAGLAAALGLGAMLAARRVLSRVSLVPEEALARLAGEMARVGALMRADSAGNAAGSAAGPASDGPDAGR